MLLFAKSFLLCFDENIFHFVLLIEEVDVIKILEVLYLMHAMSDPLFLLPSFSWCLESTHEEVIPLSDFLWVYGEDIGVEVLRSERDTK
jgi:hypothetical protein